MKSNGLGYLTRTSRNHSLKRVLRGDVPLITNAFASLADEIELFIPDPETEDRIAEERERCENDIVYFVKNICWPVIEPGRKFVDGWHIDCIGEHLKYFYEGKIKKLIINIPPRHCKSIMCSIGLFCWGWAKNPTSRWIFTTYSLKLSRRDNMSSSSIIASRKFQEMWGRKFQLEIDTQDHLKNTMKGQRNSLYVGGGGTGDGAEFIVADDPLSAEGAKSKSTKQTCIDFFSGTLASRINDPENMNWLIVQQRLARDDLSGIKKEQGYETLILPIDGDPKRIFIPGSDVPPSGDIRDAIKPTSLQLQRPELMDQREEGEPLWPERFTPDFIRQWRIEIGDNSAGQLDQRPREKSGNMFDSKEFRYFRLVSTTTDGLCVELVKPDSCSYFRVDDCEWFQTIDTAMEIKKNNDCTAIATLGLTPEGDLLVFHIFSERIEIPDQLPAIMIAKVGVPNFNVNQKKVFQAEGSEWPFSISWQGIEPKSSGIGIFQSARRLGIYIRKLKVSDSKEGRAASAVSMYQSGCIYHLKDASWLLSFESSLCDFPKGRHDDDVDALAYGALHAVNRGIKKYYRENSTTRPLVLETLPESENLPQKPIEEPKSISNLIGQQIENVSISKTDLGSSVQRNSIEGLLSSLISHQPQGGRSPSNQEDKPRFQAVNRTPLPTPPIEEVIQDILAKEW